jgi:lipopolysaccharide transport system ATP-binding protein
MMMRLAFAVQTQINPDILIVDEALAVGDAKFQARCFERLKQLNKIGTSILLVTHSTEQIVTHCSYAILLNEGRVIEAGVPRYVANRYMDLLFGHEVNREDKTLMPASVHIDDVIINKELNTEFDVFSTRPGYNPHEYRWGDGTAKILDFCIVSDNTLYPTVIEKGQIIKLIMSIKFIAELICPIIGITIKTKEGVTIYGVNSETLRVDALRSLGSAGSVIRVEAVFKCRFAPGDYFISLGVATKHGEDVIPQDRRYDSIHLHVLPNSTFFGLIDVDMKFIVAPVVL